MFTPLNFLYNYRSWFALICLATSMLGSYVLYDSAGSLAVWLDQDVDITPTKLGLLYSAYSAPIILIALICGHMIDRIGHGPFMFLFQFMVCAGTGLFASAYNLENHTIAFIVMMTSRVIGGIGSDGFAIVCRKLVFRWFEEKNQGLAMSVIMTFPFFGTQFAFIVLPLIATYFTGAMAFWLVFCTCVMSSVFMIIYVFIERFWPPKHITVTETKVAQENVFLLYFHTIKSLHWKFWLLMISDMLLQGAIWPFVAFSPDFFYHHYGFTTEQSGAFATLIAAGAIPFAMFVGYSSKRIPKPLIGILASVLQVVCFLQLGWLTSIRPIYSTLGLAMMLGCVGTCIYSSASNIVPYDKMGMALGILKSAESISWLITPPVYGAIYEYTGNFGWCCTFFACLGLGALPLQIILFITRKSNPVVAAPVKDVEDTDSLVELQELGEVEIVVPPVGDDVPEPCSDVYELEDSSDSIYPTENLIGSINV